MEESRAKIIQIGNQILVFPGDVLVQANASDQEYLLLGTRGLDGHVAKSYPATVQSARALESQPSPMAAV
jgi:hypothetical protein